MKNRIRERVEKIRSEEPQKYDTVTEVVDVPCTEARTIPVVKRVPITKEVRRGGITGFFGAYKEVNDVMEFIDNEFVTETKTTKDTRTRKVEIPENQVAHYWDEAKKNKSWKKQGKDFSEKLHLKLLRRH